MDLEARVRRLEAAEDIRSLKARYCDLCDTGYDAAALSALFVDDAVWDGGEVGVFEGRAAIERFFAGTGRALALAIHHVTNAALQVSDDAGSATGRWYLLQCATRRHDNQALWLAARYEDSFVRTADGWRFARIQIRTQFFTPFEEGWARIRNVLG